jgi:hypothetical protein
VYQKNKLKIVNYIDRYRNNIIVELISVFIIFNLLTGIPYVNLYFENIFIKLFLLWLVTMLIFKINYEKQMITVIGLFLVLPLLYFISSQNYENIGNIIYLLILFALLSFIIEVRRT